MTRVILSLLVCVTLLNTTHAQKKERGPYDYLLWRISGKGLQKPSYVYGTMHLTDKRLFYFTDSLYRSLERSEGFAAELDMETLMPHLVKEMFSDEDMQKKIVNVVNKEELLPYKKQLEKATKKSLDKITIHDLREIRTRSNSEIVRAGEMNTIMDMYLFDIARRQGKWVGGIEDLEDQLSKNDQEEEVMSMVYEATSDKSQTKKMVEWMIKTYLAQDLQAIDLTNEIWKGAEKEVLIRRNIKMARRMDSIMQIRTCLFAVGAAHIPGDSGVVTLLRKKGFVVEPVYSTNKIDPARYTFVEKEIKWVPVEIKDNWYGIEMPGKAEIVNMDDGELFLSSHFYMDLARLNAYFTLSAPLPATKTKNLDTLYRAMALNMAKKGKLTSEKDITVNGITGKEFLIKAADADVRVQTFVAGSVIIMNLISSNKSDSLYGTDARNFFSSFRLLKDPPVAKSGGTAWKKSDFPEHAFSIRFPGNYKPYPRELDSPAIWRTKGYTHTDIQSQVSCWMFVMESGKGYYADSDTGYFEQVRASALATGNTKVNWTKTTRFDGYPASEFSMTMEYEQQEVQVMGKVVNRGNRRYYFYAVYVEGDSTKAVAEQFVHSFRFLPLPEQRWDRYVSPDNDFTVWSPVPVERQVQRDYETGQGFMLYDSLSPVTVMIDKSALPRYSWWVNDSIFFRQQAGRYVGYGDTLLTYERIKTGKLEGADLTVGLTDNHNVKRVKLILNGDTLYSFYSFLPPSLLTTGHYKKLFNEILFSKEEVSANYLQNKTVAILDQLTHGDSADFEAATEALGAAPFSAAELPALQNALMQPYRDFDSGYYTAHSRLTEAVIKADDGTTLDFVRRHYKELTGTRAKMRYSFVSLLLRLQSRESFALAKQFLTDPAAAPSGSTDPLYTGLSDSLQLTATLFPELLQRSADTAFIDILTYILPRLIDSGLVSVKTVLPYKENFYKYARKELARLKGLKEDYDYDGYNTIELLGKLREPAAWQLLQQYAQLPSPYLNQEAAIVLIKQGQTVPAARLERIAANDGTRISFYHQLEEMKKLQLFPAKYKTQQYMARAEVYVNGMEDYSPSSISLVGERSVMFQGKKQRFYLYKVTYEIDTDQFETYLGVAGPYAVKTTRLDTNSRFAGVYDEAQFDLQSVNEQFEALLKRWEEISEQYPD